MKKGIFVSMLVFILALVVAIPVFAAQEPLSHAQEVEALVFAMMEEKRADIIHSRGMDYRQYENLHLHPYYEQGQNPRIALFREFVGMVEEVNTRASTLGRDDAPSVIIGLTSYLDIGLFDGRFFVGFTSEEYTSLLSLMVDFTGIEREMIEHSVVEFRLPTMDIRPISSLATEGHLLSSGDLTSIEETIGVRSTTTLTMEPESILCLQEGLS